VLRAYSLFGAHHEARSGYGESAVSPSPTDRGSPKALSTHWLFCAAGGAFGIPVRCSGRR
jgi:hypothetical protein